MATTGSYNRRIHAEERLVAELEKLGIRYLSRRSDYRAKRVRPPQKLLADLVRQPSSRVRTALIAVLLAHPEYGTAAPTVVRSLSPVEQWTLKLLYTAAVLLQRAYATRLQAFLGQGWRWLPDWFSGELNLPTTTPSEQLRALSRIHQQKTGILLNWAGTYDHAARHLLHRWELERTWNRSL